MTEEELADAIEFMSPEDRKFLEDYVLYLKDWHANPIMRGPTDEPMSDDEFAKMRN